jgi:hypothetical protein
MLTMQYLFSALMLLSLPEISSIIETNSKTFNSHYQKESGMTVTVTKPPIINSQYSLSP